MFNPKSKKSSQTEVMDRQETSVWLGRALSTNEVILQGMVDLLAIVSFQQQVIQVLYEKSKGGSDQVTGSYSQAMEDLEGGSTTGILQKLAEMEENLKPVREMVINACETLAKNIKSK